jgi:hypothetical protein
MQQAIEGCEPMTGTRTLYTYQAPNHDITRPHVPLTEYTDDIGSYYEIAQHLQWPSWIWCFSDKTDFDNEITEEWLTFLPTLTLWTLRIPERFIKWCGLVAQCNNQLPIKYWFADSPDEIRLRHDLPMALVKCPIHTEWIMES